MAPALIYFALDNFIMKHRSFYAHIGFDQNTASGQIIILIRNIPLFCRFCIRPVSMCADRSLRGTPGDSRILRASAGGGCGPRGSRNRPKTAEGHFADKHMFRHIFIEDTPFRHNQADACFCARLFVHWLAPKILSLGKMQASLLLPSLIRIFAPIQTFARI